MDDSSAEPRNSDQQHSFPTWLSYTIVGVVIILIGVGAYFGYQAYSQPSGEGAKAVQPMTTVVVAEAKNQTWQSQLEAVGTITAVRQTELTSEMAGKVVGIEFDSADRVKDDQLLVKLDTSSEEAELDSLVPQLKQATADATRAQELIQSNAISEEAYEEAYTEAKRLQADISQQQAIIERKKIRAPFSGELGIRMVDLGQYIQPGTAVASLQQITPIYVDFDLPEQNAGRISAGQSIKVSVTAFPDETFMGKVVAVTPLIEEATRSFTVRGELANDQRKLKPGMFADVVVLLPERRDVVTVPRTAIAFNAYGKSLFVVRPTGSASDDANTSTDADAVDDSPDEQLVARRVFVQTGQGRGLDIEIAKGLAAGERVVTAGQLKLSDNAPVEISDDDVTSDVAETPRRP
ncbi:MAG: efflux RND transporter periplasmic adaptor subunit [Pirellulaceae bacterium]